MIKQAARQLFFQFGYQKTALEDIARQAGMAKPTLYYYYPSKESIFEEIVAEEAGKMLDAIVGQIPEELSADRKLETFYRLLFASMQKYARKMQNAPEVICEGSPHGRPIVKMIFQMLEEKIRPILIEGQQSGIFQITDIDLTVQSLLAMMRFLTLDWIRSQGDAGKKIFNQLTNLVLDGLKNGRQI